MSEQPDFEVLFREIPEGPCIVLLKGASFEWAHVIEAARELQRINAKAMIALLRSDDDVRVETVETYLEYLRESCPEAIQALNLTWASSKDSEAPAVDFSAITREIVGG